MQEMFSSTKLSRKTKRTRREGRQAQITKQKNNRSRTNQRNLRYASPSLVLHLDRRFYSSPSPNRNESVDGEKYIDSICDKVHRKKGQSVSFMINIEAMLFSQWTNNNQ